MNTTNFHDRFQVRNNTRLESAPSDTLRERRRGGGGAGSKSKMESWDDGGANEFTGYVKRNSETGMVMEVSPRTMNGQKITGSANDKAAREAAMKAFVEYERKRLAEKQRAEQAERFNEAQKMADGAAARSRDEIRRSEIASTRRMDQIRDDAAGRASERPTIPGRITGSSNIRARKSEATGETVLSTNQPPDDGGSEEVEAVCVGGGRIWESATWTGPESDYLKIPYDGVTAPSYVEKTAFDAFDWTTMPADDGSDDRAYAKYIQISRTSGPVHYVDRA